VLYINTIMMQPPGINIVDWKEATNYWRQYQAQLMMAEQKKEDEQERVSRLGGRLGVEGKPKTG